MARWDGRARRDLPRKIETGRSRGREGSKREEKSVEGAIRGASGGRVLGREVCPRKKERRYGFYSAGFCCFHTILLWFLGFLGLLNFLLFMLMPGWEYVGFCYALVGLELVCAWFF